MNKYRKKINEKGLKMVWVAEKCNIKKSALSNYLAGIRTMPTDVEAKLKDLLM